MLYRFHIITNGIIENNEIVCSLSRIKRFQTNVCWRCFKKINSIDDVKLSIFIKKMITEKHKKHHHNTPKLVSLVFEKQEKKM